MRSPAEQRAELLASAKDVVRLDWKPAKDASGASASGDVVWSPSEQRGYMRLLGLAANDPRVAQYQLWIFDKGRDARYPVDGGVFDVAAGGEVVVPIAAKLHVDAPTLFAVTVERPGGVVVSDRKRIAVLASAG
jgi:anti-sigma-K factor RskA